MKTHCRHCGTYKLENSPGDYYHEKACEARKLRAELVELDVEIRKSGHAPVLQERRRQLLYQIELADYVGD